MDQKPNFIGLSDAGKFYRGKDDWMRDMLCSPNLSAAAKIVGCYLALHVNKNTGDTFKKQATIAKDMGVSRHTVMRAITELIEGGYLKKEKDYNKGLKRARNRYSLIMPWE